MGKQNIQAKEVYSLDQSGEMARVHIDFRGKVTFSKT